MKNFKNTILKKMPIIFTHIVIIDILSFCFCEGYNFKRYVEEQKTEFEKNELTQCTENIEVNEDIYDRLTDTYLDYYESIEQQADEHYILKIHQQKIRKT